MQKEYELRSSGRLQELEGGAVRLNGINLAREEDPDQVERQVVYSRAIENFQRGRYELNDLADGHGLTYKGNRDPDVLAVLKSSLIAAKDNAQAQWASATAWGVMHGGNVRNTKEVLARDGFGHCP